MREGLTTVLLLALAVAISPLAIIAVVVLLVSSRPRLLGSCYLLGWMGALSGASVLSYLFGAGASDASSSGALLSWVKLAVGVGLLVLGWRSWRQRPGAGEEPPMPGWLSGADHLGPAGAAGLGALFIVKPKNLLLVLAMGGALADRHLPGPAAAGSIAAFVVLGSVLLLVPVLAAFFGGAGTTAALESLKAWLLRHNAVLLAVLLTIFGLALLAQGVAAR